MDAIKGQKKNGRGGALTRQGRKEGIAGRGRKDV